MFHLNVSSAAPVAYLPALKDGVSAPSHDRQEIQFYGVREHRLERLQEELDKADLDPPLANRKYEFYQSHIIDDIWLVLVRPRLLN